MSTTYGSYTRGSISWNPVLGPNPNEPVTKSVAVASDERYRVTASAQPSWAQARKRGFVVLPYSVRRETVRKDIIRVYHRHTADNYGLLNHFVTAIQDDSGSVYPTWELSVAGAYEPLPSLDAEINSLKIAVQNALYSADFDLSTNVAELRETLEMLGGFFKALRNPFRDYRHLENLFRREKPPYMNKHLAKLYETNYSEYEKAYKRAAQAMRAKRTRSSMNDYIREISKILADMRLTWRYGIQPVIYSIQDLMKVLRKSVRAEFTKRETRSSKVDLYLPPTPEAHITSAYTGQTKTLSTVSRKGELKVTVGAIASLKYKSVDDAFRAQFGVNPFITAYELIPLSFVLDWFINLGDWIGSLQRPEAVVEVAGWISVRGSYTTTQKFSALDSGVYKVTGSDYFHQWNDSGVWSKTVDSFDRTLWNPSEPLLPSFNIDISKARALDALALLRNIVFK